jgi:hypothetical protein
LTEPICLCPSHLASYFKFGLYPLVQVLVNVASITLFARLDLTRAMSYSPSDVSRKVVSLPCPSL